MRLLAHDRFPDLAFAAAHQVELLSLNQLLLESDFITLHVRLNEETRGMIGERQLNMMKPTAFLINAARRELVDEDALVKAILEHRIGGAGLDDAPGLAGKELFGLPNVVFSTHLGNRALEGVISTFRSAVDSAVAVLRGQRPKLVVNPDVYERGLRS
jgi:D-3-phosphoglycerate dehydrogenase